MTSTDTTNAGRRAALHRDTTDHLPPKGTAVFAAKAAHLGRMATPDLDTHFGPALPDAEPLDIRGEPTILGADRGDQPAIVVCARCPFLAPSQRTPPFPNRSETHR
jgi:hypothetical protein